jgi:hypothetical protein
VRRILAKAERKATMSKTNSPFPSYYPVDDMCQRPFGKNGFNLDFGFSDKRLSRLLVLLQQVDQYIHGLHALPEFELNEIVSGALNISGFVDPAEGMAAIAHVLCALETRDAIPVRVTFRANSGLLS